MDGQFPTMDHAKSTIRFHEILWADVQRDMYVGLPNAEYRKGLWDMWGTIFD